MQPTGEDSIFHNEWNSLSRLIKLLERKGRWGGLVALALAVALGAIGIVVFSVSSPWNGEESWSPFFFSVSLTCMIAALASGAAGLGYLVFPVRLDPTPERDSFLRVLRRSSKPVQVCLRCRIIHDEAAGTECPQCLSDENFFIVTTEADVSVVAAALR